jgi:hypothetical protein
LLFKASLASLGPTSFLLFALPSLSLSLSLAYPLPCPYVRLSLLPAALSLCLSVSGGVQTQWTTLSLSHSFILFLSFLSRTLSLKYTQTNIIYTLTINFTKKTERKKEVSISPVCVCLLH